MTLFKSFKLLCLSLLLALPRPALATDNASKQIACLADNAYFEARGQSTEGQLAVMHVVLNRTKSPRYPDTPCKVIYQGCQFSWVCHGSRKISERKVYDNIHNMASRVYQGKTNDNTNGAIYFRHVRVGGHCKAPRIIGQHKFCK
jgi:spore germination cell wall hydrolase CwlJ-like protein